MEVNLRADGANVRGIHIGEVAADAGVEDGAAANGQGVVAVDTPARIGYSICLELIVELELSIMDYFTLAVVLIVKDAVCHVYDGFLVAFRYTLQRMLINASHCASTAVILTLSSVSRLAVPTDKETLTGVNSNL